MASHLLGPYRVDVPEFVASCRVRDAAPLHRANIVVQQGVTFDVTIVLKMGTDDEASRLLEAMADGYGATLRATHEIVDRGNHYTQHIFDAYVDGMPLVTEQFIAFPFGDLFHVALSYTGDVPQVDGLRALLLSMANGAITRRQQS